MVPEIGHLALVLALCLAALQGTLPLVGAERGESHWMAVARAAAERSDMAEKPMSAREFKLPIRFVGVGEKIDDLVPFDPQAFVDSILPA